MYQNLRLSGHKALTQAALVDLGRVNVICGQNSSGKSTVLEAITMPGKRSAGRVLGKGAAEQVFKASCGAMGWRDQNRDESRHYERLVHEIVGEEQLWYEDDMGDFVTELAEKYEKNRILNGWAFGSGAVQKAYQQLFPAKPACVLLPAKRRLELSRAITSREEPQPDGSGILNYLFFAKNQPNDSADRHQYDRIALAFEEISLGYRFEIFLNRDNTLNLQFAAPTAPWIPAQDCGLGLQDLLIIITFAARPDYPVLAIEEPENHLHPSMQRRLLFYLREQTDKQLFVTTHSNVFLNNAAVDRVFFTRMSGTILVDDATSRASILDDLGYSVADNLVSDLVILVEGPSDVAVVEELLKTFGLLQRYTIKLWPLGGDIMDKVDLSVLSGQYVTTALIDRDPGSGKVRRRFEARCKANNIPVHRLKRYSIENYFTPAAIRAVFKGQVPQDWTEVDPATSIDKQLGFHVKSRNRDIARMLSREDVIGTDLGGFIRTVEQACMHEGSRTSAA